jgi:ABC-2 type transport system permease protein
LSLWDDSQAKFSDVDARSMNYWYESLAVAQRILIELLRRRRSLILWIIFPLSLLAINTLIVSERGNITIAQAVSLIAPSALVGAALFFSCLGGTVATVVAEREQRTLKRLFLSPLSGLSYFCGIFLAHSCIGLGQMLLVFTMAVLWGAQFLGNPLLIFAIVILSIIAYVGIGFVLSTQLAKRTEDVNSLVAAFGIPLLILGGAFFPTSFFPQSLLRFADFNPVYHMNEALVRVSTNGESLMAISDHLSFLTAFATATLIVAWFSYDRMLRNEKKL